VPHTCESATCDVEHVPPHDSGVIERVRDCEPPPHDTEHAPQFDHKPIWQLTGQQTLLQPCESTTADSAHVPPHDAGVIVRLRVCVPPVPHDAEQADQPDHGKMTQFCGQQPGEQARDSVKLLASGHGPPLVAGVTMVRERVSVPVPHETEQVQGDHDDATQAVGQPATSHGSC
jgi:hypothetical protein